MEASNSDKSKKSTGVEDGYEDTNASNIEDLGHLSYSRINSYIQCPRKFKKKYIDGVIEEPNKFARFGQLIHSVLEKSHKKLVEVNFDGPLVEYENRFKTVFKDEWKELKRPLGPDMYSQGMEMIERYTRENNFYASIVKGVERDFAIELYGMRYKGIVDLLMITPDN